MARPWSACQGGRAAGVAITVAGLGGLLLVPSTRGHEYSHIGCIHSHFLLRPWKRERAAPAAVPNEYLFAHPLPPLQTICAFHGPVLSAVFATGAGGGPGGWGRRFRSCSMLHLPGPATCTVDMHEIGDAFEYMYVRTSPYLMPVLMRCSCWKSIRYWM